MTLASPAFWTSVLVLVAVYLSRKWSKSKKNTSLLPPGPPRTPLLGNALEVEATHGWYYYTRLADKYGDVVSIDVLGQPIITLNTFDVCNDILIKKSNIYKARPHLTMCAELVGFEPTVGLAEGETWSVYRKLTANFLGPKATTAYYSLIEKEARALPLRMLTSTDDFMTEFKYGVGVTVLEMAFGIQAKGKDDSFITEANQAIAIFSESAQPGKWLVDSFPILKHVPAWFPLAGFQRTAAEWRPLVESGMLRPFKVVKGQMAAGPVKPSFTSRALEDPPVGATDERIAWASGSLYAASVDTITSTMHTFVLSMVLNPEIQAKAQAEIDRVVGSERMPTLADRPSLPYIDALLKESMRIHPPVPMGLPYRALEDVQYRGWVIPENAVVMSNPWNISRDPVMYPSPYEFQPERFLNNPDILDPHRYVFGFGRRICPGQYLADATLFISIAATLATFNFSKAKDSLGQEITPDGKYTGNLICEPLPFPYEVSPRSDAAAALIRESNHD